MFQITTVYFYSRAGAISAIAWEQPPLSAQHNLCLSICKQDFCTPGTERIQTHTPALLKLLEVCRCSGRERFLATFCQKPHCWTRAVFVPVSEINQQRFCRDGKSHSHCSIMRARCWEGNDWLAHARSLISLS